MDEVLPHRGTLFRRVLSWYWRITILGISPPALLAVFAYYMYDAATKPLQYEAWKPNLVRIFNNDTYDSAVL